MISPAIDGTAMVIVIQVTLKTIIYMKNPIESSFDQYLARFQGALATAADQYHRGAAIVFNADRSTEHHLSDIGKKMGILDPVRFVDPGDVNGPPGVSDEQKLHAGADIHQYGAGVVLK